MIYAKATCSEGCENVQRYVRALFGRVTFVADKGVLSGTTLHNPEYVYAFGLGDGPGDVEPWIDLSKVSEADAIKAIEAIIKQEGQLRGLGDVVAKATKLVGIVPCAGCAKRQAALNRMFPSKSYKNTLASAANADKVGEKVRP